MHVPPLGIAIQTDQLIRTAIQHRNLIRLIYTGKPRIVEPHDYGIHKGIVKLLAYQIGGASSGKLPNWRWFEVQSISSIEILDKHFAGGRTIATGKHHHWDEVFIRVAPARLAPANPP